MSKTILVVDDEKPIADILQFNLKKEGYNVVCAYDGDEALKKAEEIKPDLMLLDIMLPSRDGMEVCREIRKKYDFPIIMLTAKDSEIDKVLGLELGADDYVTKPFSIRELLARVKALIRRSTYEPGDIEEVAFANLKIDFKKQEMLRGENPVRLSATEYRILHYFIDHEGEVISRDKFLDEVWGYDSYPTTRTVDNYILSLRKKIEDDPANPKHLLTIHKVGYKFVK